MIYVLLIIIIAVLAAYAAAQGQSIKKRVKAAEQKGMEEFLSLLIDQGHESRLEWFRFLNASVQKGGVLFVGDSLTQEFLLEEYYSDSLVYNRGIGGDTTEGLLKRMKESIYDLEPSKMFLLIGTNDLAVNVSKPEKIVENIKKIILATKEKCKSTEIYVESLYPTGTEGYDNLSEEAIKNRSNYAIDVINQGLEILCEELKVTYIDINSKLKGKEGRLKPELTRDGLHLRPEGYRVVIDSLKKYI
ncbi:GDSL-type esterase/lipase family protein [Clostridium swellfunianum]|uniref:GDSL-type esterase/lipase family protein n=1 Tax=Clostridium swellfunianum TaxID=1367462 RepID=UPI0020306722|nr:GDSL-type esterase/lipase family protein [Clostridium swellfunianum]MCM0647313.1 GDSL-type esterase/lipase family protein [Clostridium swellfunianum]